MIGSGDHLGFVGIRLSTGIIGQHGGIHIIALPIISIGIICIGITTIIHIARTAQHTISILIMRQCVSA
jgi:hypothetical protein